MHYQIELHFIILDQVVSNCLPALEDIPEHVDGKSQRSQRGCGNGRRWSPRQHDLIVKPADKGGAIVIWPKDSYLAEAYRQLNNPDHYQKLPHDPTPEILAEAKKLSYNLHK